MHSITTLDQATKMLLHFAPQKRAIHYDLSKMKQLMTALGNPQNSLRVIHVAGTSGKTSTCYYIRALLESGGHRTGMTVSPHIVSINERVQIGGTPLAEEMFISYLQTFMEIVETSGLTPSYYELTMAFAYYVFRKERVDYAVIETGLGGLLDGSNVVERADKVCVIQRIGYDHTEILGDSLQEIALQKAGIIQQGNTVLLLDQPQEIVQVITEYAKTKQANIYTVHERHHNDITVAYQHANWTMATAVYEFLRKRDNLSVLPPDVLTVAQKSTPPGRYEWRKYNDRLVIFDGAHNQQKLEALLRSLPQTDSKPTVVFSLKETANKKIDDCIKVLSAYCGLLVITTFMLGQDNRVITSVSPDILDTVAKKFDIPTVIKTDPKQALEYATEHSTSPVVVTGSLYLVSTIRKFTQG